MSWKQVKSVVLGKTLQNADLESEKLGRFWGVSIMASDAVSSVAYAIEEMLIILVPTLGLSAVGYLGYAAAPIIVLVLVLAFSYSQIIASYPNGGGAYVVSAENINRSAALAAAAALIVDYVMTVAVSLSSATAALISAFPQLHDMRVPLAMLFLCVITLFNLRGMRESSKVFGIPTYAFILVMGILLGTGFIKMAMGTLKPVVYAPDVAAEAGMGAVSLMLLLEGLCLGLLRAHGRGGGEQCRAYL